MFEGFTEKTGEFFWELAFNNERTWFTEHKQEFEDAVNTPFKALAGDTFALMEAQFSELDCRLHISRIYRDARRLFGRGPYKDHLWFSIKASAVLLEGPMFWFEIGAKDYAYGMGFYSATAEQMAAYRRSIDANPAGFVRMVSALEKKGFHMDCEQYKRPKKVFEDETLNRWYNCKRVGLDKSFDLMEDAGSRDLPALLLEEYRQLMPLYGFFMDVYNSCPTEKKGR